MASLLKCDAEDRAREPAAQVEPFGGGAKRHDAAMRVAELLPRHPNRSPEAVARRKAEEAAARAAAAKAAAKAQGGGGGGGASGGSGASSSSQQGTQQRSSSKKKGRK